MIKLILSILGPALFIANFWVCEWLYPNPESSWDVFIPMDMLCHNFWAVTLGVYTLINLFPLIYPITNYFIYLSVCFSFFDVSARYFSMTEFNSNWYLISLILSFIIAGIAYGISGKYNNRASK
jgi:uncharacterized membrane protein